MTEEEKPNVEIVVREVQCAKETLEVGEGLAGMLKDVRQALADGWQPGQDIPVILSSAMARLGTAVDGALKVNDERKASPQAFVNAVMLPVADAVGSFL